jgi:hypothetical protein
MGTGNAHEGVSVIKLLRDILAERVASSSGRDTPTASVVRVGPKEIADRAFMRDFLNSVKLLDLV